MILESMLADAGLTKHQLADNLGVSIKTIYSWSAVPQYAVAYLELYTRCGKLEHLATAINSVVNNDQYN